VIEQLSSNQKAVSSNLVPLGKKERKNPKMTNIKGSDDTGDFEQFIEVLRPFSWLP
jgi:hypothetical protein